MPLHTYPIAPAIISDEVASLAGSSTVLSANTVYLSAFELQAPTVVLGVKWIMVATATGKTNIGIYTLAGNLVAGSDTGQQTNTASSDNSFTYGTSVLLSPGQYLMALAPSNSTDTYLVRAVTATGACRERRATNAMSAGALPSTTGAFVVTGNFPAYSLTIQGGL